MKKKKIDKYDLKLGIQLTVIGIVVILIQFLLMYFFGIQLVGVLVLGAILGFFVGIYKIVKSFL